MVKKTEPAGTGNDAQRGDQDIIIPVIHEEVIIDRQKTVNATLTIRKDIITEDVTVDLPLSTEHLNVEHVPVNQLVDSRPEIRYEDDVIIIPVIKEVVVKRLLLVEEIRVTRITESSDYTETLSLKKEEVKITKENKQVG